jgi:hypothetical protein
MKLSISSLACLLLLTRCVHAQETSKSDLEAFLKSCRVVQLTLSAREGQRANGDVPGDDDFTAAARGCVRLQKAISASDSREIQETATALRPLMARLGSPPSTPKEQFVAAEKKASGLRGQERFYQLSDLAKRAFNAQEIEKAQAFAKELLSMAPQYRNDWNYGNAIFYGNLVLGRIAVRRGNLDDADKYLLQAGSTPGSPQLDSFGPNMTLAKELLQSDHTRVVLQYFGSCKKFWELGQQKLDEWTTEVKNGKLPDFGANLNY